jgi:hypothetical protein
MYLIAKCILRTSKIVTQASLYLAIFLKEKCLSCKTKFIYIT